jgi:hypothetical protein
MAQTTVTKAKATVARKRVAAKKVTSVKAKPALDRTADVSKNVLKSVEHAQRTAIEAVRTFVDTLDETLPVGEHPSRREHVIDAALDMADKLVTTQYDFLRGVVYGADRSLRTTGTTARKASPRAHR